MLHFNETDKQNQNNESVKYTKINGLYGFIDFVWLLEGCDPKNINIICSMRCTRLHYCLEIVAMIKVCNAHKY